MSCGTLKKKGKGFTLVELLIVLAIIGILAAILLPVFARVRATARTTTCQSNLKQIGTALQLYSADHNSKYPPVVLTSNCYYPDALMPYLKTRAVFTCPARPDDIYYSACSTPEIKDATLLSYHGSYVFNIPDGRVALSSLRIAAPSLYFLLIEGQSSGARTSVSDGSGPLSDEAVKHAGWHSPHNGSANALFGDGHVKWLPSNEWQQRNHWNLAGHD